MPDQEIETRYYNQRTGKEEWRCKHCDKTYLCSGGTAAPAKHLMDPPPDGHGLPKGAPRTAKVTNIRSILQQARAMAEQNPRKRRRLNDQSGDSIDPDQLEVLYVRFITACSLPFRLVECSEFRALLAYLNSDIDTWLPDTHETIKKWIMMMPISYNVAKQFPDYIITIIVEIPIKKWIMMMPISYNVVKRSPDS